MESEAKQVVIESGRDIPIARQITRTLTHEWGISVKDQARISWIVDYIARQGLLGARSFSLYLIPLSNDSGRLGLRIECQGDWLRPFGPLYEAHLVPVFSRLDFVKYTNHPPSLLVVAWSEDIVGEEK